MLSKYLLPRYFVIVSNHWFIYWIMIARQCFVIVYYSNCATVIFPIDFYQFTIIRNISIDRSTENKESLIMCWWYCVPICMHIRPLHASYMCLQLCSTYESSCSLILFRMKNIMSQYLCSHLHTMLCVAGLKWDTKIKL